MPRSPWKDGFLFVGNQLALDFLNTRPVINGEAAELLPDFDAILRWFRAGDLLTSREVTELRHNYGESRKGRGIVHRLQAWRERLRATLVDWESGHRPPKAMLEELNCLLAEYPLLTRLRATNGRLEPELWFRPQTPESLVAPIAHSAAMLFATADRRRVRKCGHCVLHFLDTSKKGTRRWCSMELCGNRFKVAAYAARQRKSNARRPGDRA
jgi:predicted RNA-binding Zn ribbon-like protein